MKQPTWDHPNKMHFSSPLKVFNEQTCLICPGNALLDTQYSSYIRPFTQTDGEGGRFVEEGLLQKFDLESFTDVYHIPAPVLVEIRALTHDQTGILYLFKHYTQQEHIILDGLVLTDEHFKHRKTWYLNQDWRAQAAVEEARKYVCSDYDDNGDPVVGGDL